MKNKTFWITQTALMLALLIVLQWATSGLGQLVTGSCVNAVLAVAVLLGGIWSGLTVALVSPVCAFLLGIGPQLFALIPAIALGNSALVLVLHFAHGVSLTRNLLAWLSAALGKFLALYLVVVQLLCHVLPLKQPQIDTFTAMFSVPQLITALVGGAVAMLIVPVLKKALHR